MNWLKARSLREKVLVGILIVLLLLVGWALFGVTGNALWPLLLVPAIVALAFGIVFAILILGTLPIAAHEFGHALAAVRVGYRVTHIHLACCGFVRKDKGWSFYTNLNVRESGGYVVATAPDGIGTAKGWITLLAAGPVGSAIYLLAILIGDWFWIHSASDPFHGPAAFLFLYQTYFAVVILLSSAIPRSQKDGTWNDAKRIAELRTEEGWQTFAGSLELEQALHKSDRPRDMDRSKIESLLGRHMAPLSRLRGALVAYNFFVDSGEMDRAFAVAEEVAPLGLAPLKDKDLQRGMLFEYAYALARFKNDGAKAAQILAKAESIPSSAHLYAYYRARCSICLVVGDVTKARTEASKARAAYYHQFRGTKAYDPFELELIHELEAACRNPKPAVTSTT